MGNRTVTARNCNDLVPLVPLPSEDDLIKDGGGKYFLRPSDGRRMEYYVRRGTKNGGGTNNDATTTTLAIVNLICTTCTGRLYHKWKEAKITELLTKASSSSGTTKKKNIIFVNISTAGVGPSEPYGETLGSIGTEQYLDQTSSDVMELLSKELNVDEVITMGVSGGWEPSVHLAARIASSSSSDNKNNKKLTLKGVCCISGIPWQTKDDDFWHLSMGTGFMGHLSRRLLESSIAPYMMGYMFPITMDGLKQGMKKEELAELESQLGAELLELEIEEMNRANAYYLFVSTFLGRLTMNSNPNKLPTRHSDLSLLKESVPVHLHFSKKDTMVPTDEVKPWLLKQIPHAKLYDNDLHHMVPPIESAIEEILSSAACAK